MGGSPPSEMAQTQESTKTAPPITQPSSFSRWGRAHRCHLPDLDLLNHRILRKPDRIWPDLPSASKVSLSSRTPRRLALADTGEGDRCALPNTYEELVAFDRRAAVHAERWLRYRADSTADYRDTIQDSGYWMVEALHFRQKLDEDSSVENELHYWKEEARRSFRKLQRHGNPPPLGRSAYREDIQDSSYWQREGNHYKAILKSIMPKPKAPPFGLDSPRDPPIYELPPPLREPTPPGPCRPHRMKPPPSKDPRSHGTKAQASLTFSNRKRQSRKPHGRDEKKRKQSTTDFISGLIAKHDDGPVSSRLRSRNRSTPVLSINANASAL